MEIGIIVYSQTEHTYSVAQMLKDKLVVDGHSAKLERVVLSGNVKPGDKKNIKFEIAPDVSGYDALIFGAPVHAFSLAPPMDIYMTQLPSLQDKKIACFVTKGLPFSWTGGNSAIDRMKKIVESKNGSVNLTEVLVWGKNRNKKIGKMVQKFSSMF